MRTLTSELFERMQSGPERTAILSPGLQNLSYARVIEQIHYTAAVLRHLGIRRTDRIAVISPEGAVAALLFHCVAATAIYAPIDPACKERELSRRLSALQPTLVIVAAGQDPAARKVAEASGIPVVELTSAGQPIAGRFSFAGIEPAADADIDWPADSDLALALNTSGTTSEPKLVTLTHRQLCLVAAAAKRAYGLSYIDRVLQLMPWFHSYGIMVAAGTLLSGGSVVCSQAFDVTLFAGWLRDFRPTWYSASPSVHRAILEAVAAPDAASLRFIRSGTAPMPPDVADELESLFGVPLVDSYGLTEAPSPITSTPLGPARRKPGSVGKPVAAEVAVMDSGGNRVATGIRGEVVLRGEVVFSGYERNETANRDAFRDGWFRTGDLGYLDEDGDLFLAGRLKDLISRGSEKISPREIEETILEHAGVAEAVAFGIPHPTLGEDVGVMIVRRIPDLTEADIRGHVAERLAQFKVPALVCFVVSIPTSGTGKFRRHELAEAALAMHAGNGAVPKTDPAGAIESAVARIWSETLGLPSVSMDADYFLSGGDSLEAVRLLLRVRERLGISLTVRDIFTHRTPAALARVIGERQCAPAEARRESRREI